ncbi:MAG: asparagine synthase (glutamine-hydrolyzing) [Pleurocapsa minor GSE-CHR-MK-17-07R]|jgi:asparagine synthase (glutamine-hydrolysing)|nr:asparagine synthase (glutamine-hydrolyzing) [Pleurocapsa minor GSE-CHR-MK 17-07R]
MCGICGILDLRGQERADLTVVRAMTERITHRGPDGDGFYAARNMAMGMRRLSIIDVAGSDQPLYNENERLALVFNGEIYNYRELRAALEGGHRFRTQGDGETLIHSYEQHGTDFFASLRGMYAFALYDAPEDTTLLAVDHIGMKPLYLWEHDGLLSFASEIKCFLADPAFRPELNLDVLDTYLSFGYMLGEQTIFQGVRRLMPGHFLHIVRGSVRQERYWGFGEGVAGHTRLDDAAVIEQTRERIRESVRLHLRSDVPLGLFLSGGIDSAAMLSLMSAEAGGAVGERVKTFTVGYNSSTPDNELAQARRIAGHFGADHHERVITAEDWWDGFQRYVYHHDEPNANSSAISLMLLSEETAKHVKVVLTGLGGDELFAGYSNHRLIARIMAEHAKSSRSAAARSLAHGLGRLESYYPAFKRYRGLGALPTVLPRIRHRLLPLNEALLRSQSFDGMVFSDALRRRLYNSALKAATAHGYKSTTYDEIIARSLRRNGSDTAQALVINTWLTGNALLNCDKVTMAHSLEARVPFFDPHLLDFAAVIPPDLRMTSNKYVLREAMRPLLPAFALERPKQPFSTPILGWFADELAGRIQARLRDPSAFVRRYLNTRTLDELLDGHFSGRAPQVEVVFRLLTLETWAETFM